MLHVSSLTQDAERDRATDPASTGRAPRPERNGHASAAAQRENDLPGPPPKSPQKDISRPVVSVAARDLRCTCIPILPEHLYCLQAASQAEWKIYVLRQQLLFRDAQRCSSLRRDGVQSLEEPATVVGCNMHALQGEHAHAQGWHGGG